MSKSQIIVTSRYLKSGSKKAETKRKNYTKYIATREGAEVRSQDKNNSVEVSTENQKQLLKELISEFPDAKKYLEYEDFTSNPTMENASELISTIIERNADVIGNRQNFVGYMALRPGAEKRGQHGLFNGSDEPIVLNQVAEEVSHHPGNVWSHVVSLRREDAVRLGYDNSERWRELVMRHISDIANAQKIPLCNMKWYAAFHDTTHHPHIHLIVYSTNPKQGYLTKDGIDKIRSVFANDIFHDELQSIYQEQSLSRDELKVLSENQMSEIAKQIQNSSFTNENLEKLIMTLHTQLQSVSGKKVYGYLPKEIKETVDRIFSELAKTPQIKAMYEKWCELERAKYKTYTQREKDIPPLEQNKVFQPVRNMIIRTVMQMKFPTVDIEIEMPEPIEFDLDIPSPIDEETIDEITDNSVEISPQSKLYIKWSDSYKEAHKLIYNKNSTLEDYKKAEKLLLSESNNVLTFYDLGRLYSADKSGIKDDDKSFEFYEKALQGFIQIEPNTKKIKSYLQYQIGMMYFKGFGTSVDNQKAVEYFEKSAELGNQYAKRLLASEYISGKNFEQNIEKGISLLTECADSGDAFSCYKLGNLYLKGEIINQDLDKAEKYLLSAEDNEFTQYALGKLYLQKEKYDIEKAILYFEKSADKNMWASYQLGRLYILGADGLEKDKEKAMKFLNLSAEQGNEYAQNIFDDREKFENEMLANTIFSLFANLSRCIENDYHNKFQSGRKMIDSKLQRMIREKNQALGIKEDISQQQY
ncbi:MAG TPA: MobP3 family relaxase [Ruminococcus sp.]